MREPMSRSPPSPGPTCSTSPPARKRSGTSTCAIDLELLLSGRAKYLGVGRASTLVARAQPAAQAKRPTQISSEANSDCAAREGQMWCFARTGKEVLRWRPRRVRVDRFASFVPAAALSPCPSASYSSSVSPTTWTPFSYRVRVSLRYPFLPFPYSSSLRRRLAHVPSLGRLLLLLSRVCCQLDALEFSFDSPRPSLPSRRPTQQIKFAWSRSSGRPTLQVIYPQKELNLPSVLVFLGPSHSRFDPLSPELFSPPSPLAQLDLQPTNPIGIVPSLWLSSFLANSDS